MPARRIVVLGTMANVPFAGMAWMHGQFLLGLHRMGHDVAYLETTSAWPYHPAELTTTSNPAYALGYLARVMTGFGLADRWAYRPQYADRRWQGPLAERADDLLREADAVLNISGSTTADEVGIPCRLVWIGTDPVLQELRIANGDATVRDRVAAHQAHFSYGENIGRPGCPVPPLPFRTHPMRQPVVLPLWETGPSPRGEFTTVMNWEVSGYDVAWNGTVYTWSKHRPFEEVLGLPQRTPVPLELALGLSGRTQEVVDRLVHHGWKVVDAYSLSLDPWPYRDYLVQSAGEFSVAKDMVARTASGWFSERSACYLAAGRPVVTRETGFSRVLPTGEGLHAYTTIDEAAAALDLIRADYSRHCRAARAIAEEFFRAETVLGRMLRDLGLGP